ncbi:MAG: hypothetical protein B7X32_20615, partial [Microbacterium sp. 13-71-7]
MEGSVPQSSAPSAPAPTYRELVDELRARRAEAALGGPEKSRIRHTERGKLLARDRVDHLLDTGSPFLEVAPLAG